MNANFRSTLLRNAEVLRVDTEWIDTQVEQVWNSVVLNEQNTQFLLSIPHLHALSLSIQRHLLRRVTSTLRTGQSPLELRHYRLIEQLLQREDNIRPITLDMPDEIIVRRENDVLTFQRRAQVEIDTARSGIEEPIVLSVPGSAVLEGTPWTACAELLTEEVVENVRLLVRRQEWQQVWRILPATLHTVYLDADYAGSVLHVRTRRPGDMLRPLGMLHEKKVQDILVDKHIPRAQRDALPLFFNADGYPVWLGGVCVDERARLTKTTQRIICLKLLETPVGV